MQEIIEGLNRRMKEGVAERTRRLVLFGSKYYQALVKGGQYPSTERPIAASLAAADIDSRIERNNSQAGPAPGRGNVAPGSQRGAGGR